MDPPRRPYLVLQSRQDVEDLIADLRSAARRSARTGGKYSVFRKDPGGQVLTEIEVWLPGTPGKES